MLKNIKLANNYSTGAAFDLTISAWRFLMASISFDKAVTMLDEDFSSSWIFLTEDEAPLVSASIGLIFYVHYKLYHTRFNFQRSRCF